jgi:hypothetical protein
MINLKELKPSKVFLPPRIVLYAEGGFGKSTFGSEAPAPIFMDIEKGADNINVTRVPTNSYEDAVNLIKSLNEQEHDFKSLVIDSVDWLERLIVDQVCKDYSVKSLEDVGFGKGYEAVIKKFRYLLSGLDVLRKKGIIIIVLAHRATKRIDPPTGSPYDVYAPKMHGKTLKEDKNLDILIEWCDILLYGEEEEITKSVDTGFGNKVEKAVAKGEKVIHTTAKAGFKAKTRYDLPESIPFTRGESWSNFYNELKKGVK